jgi:hypothetical protein
MSSPYVWAIPFGLVPLAAAVFAIWLRPSLGALLDAWQRSPRRHPRQVGHMVRPDLNERHHP